MSEAKTRRRSLNVFSLSFLDAMTCGFGAVVLLYMVINAAAGLRTDSLTGQLKAEADRLDVEVLDGHRNLVELKNSVRETDHQAVVARGLSARLIETLEELEIELATYDDTTLARQEHVKKLMADLKALEESNRRLSASIPREEPGGDKVRSFVGDGDRQYLTGLKVGGATRAHPGRCVGQYVGQESGQHHPPPQPAARAPHSVGQVATCPG